MATEIDNTKVSTDRITISISNPPLAYNSAGTPGTLAWDENFIYVCIDTNLWARTNISYGW